MPALLRSYTFWTVALVVLVLAYMASPFIAAARLAEAVRERDAPAILARVDRGALGRSITRQVLRAWLAAHHKEDALGPFAQQLAAGIAANTLYPALHQMTSPETLAQLLERGWPAEGEGGKAAPRLGLNGVVDAFRHFDRASFTGVSHFRIYIDLDGDPQRRLGWRFRISGLRWKLYAMDLSPALLQDIVQRLPAADGISIEGPDGQKKAL
ncbi:DUF2939 domain-containing protein [Camelimonas abortus]|uniref:DUF2939 domain-containing protein n=1 Tax=Camelimonas abortus TaxID=1017184 RepID=A0ABV7LBP5_9HYPH